jgi:hypothetical protein
MGSRGVIGRDGRLTNVRERTFPSGKKKGKGEREREREREREKERERERWK